MHKEYFDKMSKPPATALKTIGGGRLKGMTDIKPQWRNRAMTELFGLCGFGWKYTIDRQWSEVAGNGEVMCFVNISLFVKIGETWSDAIVGTGGSQVVELEKNYDYKGKQQTPDEPKKTQYANDEGYKMALTDALSVAMKTIGIAGAIYEGSWNGSKYLDENPVLDNAILTLEEWLAVEPPLFNPTQITWAKKAIETRDLSTINIAIQKMTEKNKER